MISNIPELNDESLRSCLNDKKNPLLLTFWAPWSDPCSLTERILKELAFDYQKRLQIARINVDENAHAPAVYGVQSIPHIILFHEGKVLASIAGPQAKVKITEFIERHLSGLGSDREK